MVGDHRIDSGDGNTCNTREFCLQMVGIGLDLLGPHRVGACQRHDAVARHPDRDGARCPRADRTPGRAKIGGSHPGCRGGNAWQQARRRRGVTAAAAAPYVVQTPSRT